MASLRFVLLLFLLQLLTGCANTADMFSLRALDSLGSDIVDLVRGSEKEVELDPEELAELEKADKVQLLWQNTIGGSQIAAFSPVFEDGSVYAADESGRLFRFDASTGAQIWSIDTQHKLSGGVGAGSGMILVGTFQGEVLAFDQRGNSQWKAQVTSEVLSAPQIANDVAVVRTGDGRIFGLDALDGSRKWVYQGATPALTVRSHASVLISRGAVFAGFPGGKLTAMNLFNGNIGWEVAVSQPRGVTELERMTDVTSLPVVDDQFVCAVAYQGRVACFDIMDGGQIWVRDGSSNAGLDIDNDYVYVSKDHNAVMAYDKRSGAGVWRQNRLASRKLSAPLVRGHYIVVANHQGYVTLLRNYDGAVVARSATDGSAIFTHPEPIPGGFVVQTQKGGLYAFSVQ
ncbi:MAG: outer membrane protein assembly factor BamB [Nitrosomonas sp.]|nr:outer membrane protein assembly factor BamB [Nitrosomonas sp.]